MTVKVASTRGLSGEPPRSTAYYYGDLERLKKNPEPPVKEQNELSEYVESNEVVNDGAVREIPPLRDRQWSLPEYHTPENRKVEETYSTAGTFPMPEPKEKEPLLAELEVVGRLPLTQLDSSPGVRRSRSWYLCCPNVGDEEISRESSWRYSSLRPVTAPPMPGQNGMNSMVASQSSGRDDVATLRAERDALARALAAERQRAATAARAHDARLAELHGVIAELVRRRAADKQSRAIPEEEVSDECESTTQPAGELDNDADQSRTEQNDTSSALSPAELPTPQEARAHPDLPDDTDISAHTQDVNDSRLDPPEVEVVPPPEPCDSSLPLSERDSHLCLTTARCCRAARGCASAGSCEREHGSADARVYTASPGGCEARQAKLASRVRLRRTEESDSNQHLSSDDAWCGAAAERLALEVCAQADLREALAAAENDDCVWRTRYLQALAECRVLRCSLSLARDTGRRLYCACGELEACAVAVCAALRATDRALEAYDVLLALTETQRDTHQRAAAETVAWQVLARLEAERAAVTLGEPLLSPGPWLSHPTDESSSVLQYRPPASAAPPAGWSPAHEERLRAAVAALKADTVALRAHANNPKLFSYHDINEAEVAQSPGKLTMVDLEAAIMMQEVLSTRDTRTATHSHMHHDYTHKSESSRSRRRRERLWRETHASETDL